MAVAKPTNRSHRWRFKLINIYWQFIRNSQHAARIEINIFHIFRLYSVRFYLSGSGVVCMRGFFESINSQILPVGYCEFHGKPGGMLFVVIIFHAYKYRNPSLNDNFEQICVYLLDCHLCILCVGSIQVLTG